MMCPSDSTQPILEENAALRARVQKLEHELQTIRSDKKSTWNPEKFDSELYRAIGESMEYGIWICDAGGKNIYASESFLNLTGLTQEKCSSFGWGDVLHPDDARNTLHAWQQCVSSGEKWDREHRILGKDGEWHHILARGVPIKNARGEVLYWAGINLDISNLKITQVKLFESNQRLQALMEAIPVGVSYSHDVTSERITGNSMVFRQFEVTREENLSASAPESDAPIRKVLFLRGERPMSSDELPLQRAIAEKAPVEAFEIEVVMPSGRRWLAEVSGAPIYNEQGDVIGGIAVTLDVTERKKTETTLRASENRFRKIFKHAATGIAITGMDGRYQECNPAYCQLLGYTEKEIQQLAFQNIIHPEDIEKILAQTILLQNEEISYFSIENRYLCRDGKTVWVHTFVSILRNEIGEPAHLLTLVTDITERHINELHSLEIARRKDEFLAMLGHELRNPLAAIRYAVQMAQKIPEDTSVREFSNDVIDRQSKQLTRMVDDLLDVARIEQGRIDLQLESLNLNSLFVGAIDGVRPLLEQKRQIFTTEFEEGEIWISGDAARLEQIIGNLVTNAAKYTPERGRIHLASKRMNSEAVISVTDNGVGISSHLLPHIFDLFRQAEGPLDRSHGGLGIGLTVAKSLVEMHGGRLLAHSEGPDLGSCFTITLPLLTGPFQKNAPTLSQSPSGGATGLVRILIVDDHVDTAKALARILLRRNYEVSIAHNGLNALELAEEYRPEVFLLDLGLPGIDGYSIAQKIRNDPSFKNPLLIAISGYAQERDCQRALAAGFDHHCAKPLDITALLTLVATRTRG